MAITQHSIGKWREHIATDPLEAHQHSSLADSATAASLEPSFCTGTGDSLLSNYILPDLETADQEVIFVTCFWAAKSKSRQHFFKTLQRLSAKVIRKRRASTNPITTPVENIKVYLCFSSVSILQKLKHTKSENGYIYEPSEWNQKLGLPKPSQIPGVDLTVKSIFIRPFSVMHPKFAIVDRKFVWVPSCNVSWESWFEGAFRLRGSIVEKFYTWWAQVWAPVITPESPQTIGLQDTADRATTSGILPPMILPRQESPLRLIKSFPNISSSQDVTTLFLPSSHHQDPQFRPCPFQCAVPEPRTPLNAFTSFLFASAKKEIYIITPNITARPVVNGLLKALERGVDVTIVTNTNLMVLEQLVTAGTTTKRCMKDLIRQHKKLLKSGARDEEEGGQETNTRGELRIRYWEARNMGRDVNGESAFRRTHLKLTIVDRAVVIFGSGNMDRASWYTSQEVGVAMYSTDVAKKILDGDGPLTDVERCTRYCYQSFEAGERDPGAV
ncbi:uncharacterized protein PADG_04122 [Paracoccidioides brasiliensis Pb18]|uniref:PLD phosphodiesterase domain-containing protein n=1 Tax=Paracoccidioides brasiliensis (strain Pb18) TaxID=502780 RepID=C1GA36_PARBD|nr:uncharacterized protein PADG_04122 [Paracoccidioides brasiliensis Pb18]EEH48038.1 hypothetical protein PADG_04122 [Paracoccidioides brasiliensis Pb18]